MPDVHLPRLRLLRLAAAACSAPAAALAFALAAIPAAGAAASTAAAAASAASPPAATAASAAAKQPASGKLWRGQRRVRCHGRVRGVLQELPVAAGLVWCVCGHRMLVASPFQKRSVYPHAVDSTHDSHETRDTRHAYTT